MIASSGNIERCSKSSPIPDFLDAEAALAIHYEQVETFGGSQGLRDRGLLESAIGAAEQCFAYTGDLHQAAGQYLVSIARNHPFVDGNKRTAAACMLVFLELNGQPAELDPATLFTTVLAAATGDLDREGVAQALRGEP